MTWLNGPVASVKSKLSDDLAPMDRSNGEEQVKSSALFVLGCLAYKPYFFSQRTIFFSHNKSANSTFSHGLSVKQAQTNRVKIDEPIWSLDDMEWIISLLIVLVHVLHRHWRRWNGMRKANV